MIAAHTKLFRSRNMLKFWIVMVLAATAASAAITAVVPPALSMAKAPQ
jgi:hypothetical protein